MRKMRIATLQRANIQQRVLWGISFAILVAFILYMYFVMTMAVFASTQKDISREVGTIQSEISELESEYITLTKDIDLSFAHELGYGEPKEVLFARKTTLVRGDL